VLMAHPSIAGDALRELLMQRIEAINAAQPRPYRLSASFGCVEATGTPEDLDRWLVEADRRMYEEKAARRMGRG